MSKFFLGIHYGHNATVAVNHNGRLIFCQSEERLNRIKNSTGFPRKTLDYVYTHICKPEEVHSAVIFQQSIFGYLHLKRHDFKPYQYGQYLSPEVDEESWFSRTDLKWSLSQWYAKQVKERDSKLIDESFHYFCESLHLPRNKVKTIPHHEAHGYSAFAHIKNWGNALVFTLDSVGDYVSGTVSKLSDNRLSLLDKIDHRNSLGYYYSAITALLGMKAGEHEFKVMGLAPYANPKYFNPILEKLQKLIWLNGDGRIISAIPPTALKSKLGLIIKHQRFDNVAAAIQALTEKLVIDWVKHWTEKTGIFNVAVAGGVFMNVKACQRIFQELPIEKYFVMPSAADESTAIGASYWGGLKAEKPIQPVPFGDLYLGQEFSEQEISLEIDKAKDRYLIQRPENISHSVAKLLANNQVVARFSGRMEFGARALGNRSILASPNDFSTVEIINSSIKSRDFWMPFTPSILEEDMNKYIIDHNRIFAPYMSVTFDTTPLAQQKLKAAIHPRDKTARPQCVVRSWNPEYHDLISKFKERTGIGAVLNTSFNLHGEPNVCSPADAIHTMDNSGLKYLAIGPFLLEKL